MIRFIRMSAITFAAMCCLAVYMISDTIRYEVRLAIARRRLARYLRAA